MDTKLFRKKAIERVNSPEELNDYIRVINPTVWLVLGAIIFLLLGVIIWASFATIETRVEVAALVSNGSVKIYISSDDYSALKEGQRVDIGEISGVLREVDTTPIRVDDEIDPYIMFLSKLQVGDFVYTAEVDIDNIKDGAYKAAILVDSIHPLTFVIH